MRKLTAIQDNVFTTKLLDVIVPGLDDEEWGRDSLAEDECIMVVMNYVEQDLAQLIKNADDFELSELHVITILYNLLCSVNFMHSCNIMPRDLKPANILINSKCVPVIADFGLSRTCLEKKPEEQPRKNIHQGADS